MGIVCQFQEKYFEILLMADTLMPRVLPNTEFQKPRFVTKLEVSFRVSKMEFSVFAVRNYESAS